MNTNLARTFAALSATNEAILYAKSPDELYRQVCDAASLSRHFLASAIYLVQPETETLQFAAGSGEFAEHMRSTDMSIAQAPSRVLGLAGEAFRDQRPSISNDIANDERAWAWRDRAREARIGAAAALPLTCNGPSVGVMTVYLREAGALDDDNVAMLTRMAANISFALGNFEHERQRRDTEQAMERMSRMFAALSATNEAIMRAKSRSQLFDMVCEAAVLGAKFASASIALAEPGSDLLTVVASKGPSVGDMGRVVLATTDSRPEGRGLTGSAFRTGQPSVSNDFQSEERTRPWHDHARREGVRSVAVLPLLHGDRAVGVLMFNSPDTGTFTPELIELLQRLAENVSFARANFERADEKAQDDARKERLTRMFAALSATNEAIMRAKSRTQLFEMVCEAAVHGAKFSSTSIALAEPQSEFLRVVAAKGPRAGEPKGPVFAITAALPEGRGLTGTAFRTRMPCISNHYLSDERTRPWHSHAEECGLRSAAVLPLLKGDVAVGVLIFNSPDTETFTPELIELLQRLAENVSFALANFERADEKAQDDARKERLTRMFAALSSTNEAIMRASGRAELFDMVCDATADGGKFTSTFIAMARAGSDVLGMVAAAGPTAAMTWQARLSSSESSPWGHGISATAFRSGKPCISHDYLADPRGTALHDLVRGQGSRSLASFPLFSHDRVVGVIGFISAELDTFIPEFTDLLQRLADNISFALGNFDLADEKAKAEKQRDRLTRMFEALSSTNEAIMRASSRAELFELVCEAAVLRGTFTSTTVALAEPSGVFLRIASSKGESQKRIRNTRLATSADVPEGRGLAGTAFRTKAPCITNDYMAYAGVAHWHAVAEERGTRSGACFPLLRKGTESIGVLLFTANEKNVFSEDLVQLLAKLAENISFALDNFDRADEKAKADERIEYLASHDGLTDLPNREMFNQLLQATIEAARHSDRRFAVLFIDLDRFKTINDSLGHEAGDRLLVGIADRLRGTLRSGDAVARLGGDEFVVILGNTAESLEVETTARALLSALSQPLQLSGHECYTTASIGIAMYPADGTDVQTLTKNADMAMYLAKEDGKNGFRFFTKAVNDQSIERLMLAGALLRSAG